MPQSQLSQLHSARSYTDRYAFVWNFASQLFGSYKPMVLQLLKFRMLSHEAITQGCSSSRLQR